VLQRQPVVTLEQPGTLRLCIRDEYFLQVPTAEHLSAVVFDHNVRQLTDIDADQLECVGGVAFELEVEAVVFVE